MPKMLIVTSQTADPPLKNIGDAIGPFPDDHQFSARELEIFDVLTIEGPTLEQLNNYIENNTYLLNVHRLTGQTNWRAGEIESMRIWRENNSADWKEVVTSPKYLLSTSAFTTQDKADLADPQVSNQDKMAILAKMTDNHGNFPENLANIVTPES